MSDVGVQPHAGRVWARCESESELIHFYALFSEKWIKTDSLSGRASCQKQDFLLRTHAGLTARTLENLAVQKKLYAGEITQAEYFEWKIMWPEI